MLVQSFRALVARLDERERAAVIRCRDLTRALALDRTAIGVSRLANGWMYLAAFAALMALASRREAVAVCMIWLSACAIAYPIYFAVKFLLARVRPCDVNPALGSGVRVLDRYSCPSGHCMAATMFVLAAFPFFPAALPLLIAAWLLVAWARIAVGHHYPTDIAAGALLGILSYAAAMMIRVGS